jgi:hypothetical protein
LKTPEGLHVFLENDNILFPPREEEEVGRFKNLIQKPLIIDSKTTSFGFKNFPCGIQKTQPKTKPKTDLSRFHVCAIHSRFKNPAAENPKPSHMMHMTI